MILLIKPSANACVFGDFTVHHKDWLAYSSGTDISGDLCYDISISNKLTQMGNFPTRIPDCDSHSPTFLALFLSPDISICFTMASPPLENSDHVFCQFPLTFYHIHNGIPCFIALLMTILVLIGMVFGII